MSLKLKNTFKIFLILLNYASSYILDLTKKRKDLQCLLSKNNTLGGTDKHTYIGILLKEKYKQLTSLRLPDQKDNLILQIDASDTT